MSEEKSIKIAVVDDHSLFRKGLVNLIQQINPRFTIIAQASHGQEFLDQLKDGLEPDMVVLDLDMPRLDGHATTRILKKDYPDLGVLMLTMKDDESSLIRLLRAGVNGFLSKDVEPEELEQAIISVFENGYHYTDAMTGKLVSALRDPKEGKIPELSDQEVKFLELACTELTYKEIAAEMILSEKTIDGYRSKLFDKLEVKSRIGLVLFAIRNHFISLD